MDRECKNGACDFLVSVGDNFYLEGVNDAHDERFNYTFENVYGKYSERENIKKLDFWQITGNHDHRRNATAQLVYAVRIILFFRLTELLYRIAAVG